MKKLARYFVGVKKEMKKVRWPKRKEMVKFSVATIVIVCFLMAYFTLSDVVISLVEKVF